MILFVLVMLVIAVIEVPRLLRQKLYGELMGFGALWLTAFVYGGLVVLRVELPSVMDVLHSLYRIIPGFKHLFNLCSIPAFLFSICFHFAKSV